MPQAYQQKSKHLYLTYQDVQDCFTGPITAPEYLQEFFLFLKAVESQGCCAQYVTCCFEEYPDRPGAYHAHCLCSFSRSLTHNLRRWTFQGHTAHSQRLTHSKASVKRVLRYIIKDGYFEREHPEEEDERWDWGEALACASKADARALLQQNAPKYYITAYPSVTQFLDGHFASTNAPFIPDPSHTFVLPDGIRNWIDTEFVKVQ